MKTKEPPYTERYVRWCGRSVDKIIIYLLPDCTVLVVFVAAVVLIQTAGIMPGSERNLGETLTVQHQNTVSAMTKQMDLLTARSISLSEEITWTMEQILIEQGKTFSDINNNPQLILDQNGVPCGICGVELSQLYFALSYPAAESRFGNMVTLLAPAEGRKYDLSKSMIGNASGTYLKSDGLLKVRNGKYYQTATTETDRYFGLSSPLDARLCSGRHPMVLTLLPEDSYHQASLRSRQIWYAGTFVFLILILLMAGGVSGHFSAPIVRSLKAVQQTKTGEDGQNARIRSGISEIDALVSFLQTRSEKLKTSELPPEIEAMLQEFKVRVGKLTPAERIIFQLFIDGCDVQTAAERSFVSVATVRKHNTSINRKLEVSNREELMVYVDLFRRCGRLEELKNG